MNHIQKHLLYRAASVTTSIRRDCLVVLAILLFSSVTDVAATPQEQTPLAIPHVVRLQNGDAHPEAGYKWTNPNDTKSVDVVWCPGKNHPDHPHIVAGLAEGKWGPASGYRYRNDTPGDLTVIWVANLPHLNFSHVVSLADEGHWRPEIGYRFANQVSDDLSVVRAGPSEQQIKNACANIVMGLFANAIAQQTPEDFSDAIIIAAARSARDQLVLNALGSLFSDVPSQQLRSAANVIVLAADNRLTADDWQSQETINAIRDRLTAGSTAAGETIEVAQFIGAVVNTYQNRR